ncbi:MAG: flavin reductase family protein [Verrucomicrobiota bacterium]
MEISLAELAPAKRYSILASLIIPRPIALVSTISSEGVHNAAPFSFFNVFGSKPPILALAPGDRTPGIPKDTARNIRESGQFVVNMVDRPIANGMNQAAASLPPEISEFALAGFTAKASTQIAPPRIAEAPVSFECREHTTLQIGANRLVIGEILVAHIRDGILDPNTYRRIDDDSYSPIGRMHSPDWYCETKSLFSLSRPD